MIFSRAKCCTSIERPRRVRSSDWQKTRDQPIFGLFFHHRRTLEHTEANCVQQYLIINPHLRRCLTLHVAHKMLLSFYFSKIWLILLGILECMNQNFPLLFWHYEGIIHASKEKVASSSVQECCNPRSQGLFSFWEVGITLSSISIYFPLSFLATPCRFSTEFVVPLLPNFHLLL